MCTAINLFFFLFFSNKNLNVGNTDVISKQLNGFSDDAGRKLVLRDIGDISAHIVQQALKFIIVVIFEEFLDDVMPIFIKSKVREIVHH